MTMTVTPLLWQSVNRGRDECEKDGGELESVVVRRPHSRFSRTAVLGKGTSLSDPLHHGKDGSEDQGSGSMAAQEADLRED
jgi:hypothetical protein